MSIKRKIQPQLLEMASYYPVVLVTGPRQSGKTTLTRQAFPKKSYISLEPLDNRAFANEDPRGFFQVIIGFGVLVFTLSFLLL